MYDPNPCRDCKACQDSSSKKNGIIKSPFVYIFRTKKGIEKMKDLDNCVGDPQYKRKIQFITSNKKPKMHWKTGGDQLLTNTTMNQIVASKISFKDSYILKRKVVPIVRNECVSPSVMESLKDDPGIEIKPVDTDIVISEPNHRHHHKHHCHHHHRPREIISVPEPTPDENFRKKYISTEKIDNMKPEDIGRNQSDESVSNSVSEQEVQLISNTSIDQSIVDSQILTLIEVSLFEKEKQEQESKFSGTKSFTTPNNNSKESNTLLILKNSLALKDDNLKVLGRIRERKKDAFEKIYSEIEGKLFPRSTYLWRLALTQITYQVRECNIDYHESTNTKCRCKESTEYIANDPDFQLKIKKSLVIEKFLELQFHGSSDWNLSKFYEIFMTLPYVSKLKPAVQFHLASGCRIEKYAAGKTIFRKGNIIETIYIILNGICTEHVSVHKQGLLQVATQAYTNGECLGGSFANALLKRNVSITALTSCSFICIDRSYWLNAMRKGHQEVRNLQMLATIPFFSDLPLEELEKLSYLG
jgi:hypothetical protein